MKHIKKFERGTLPQTWDLQFFAEGNDAGPGGGDGGGAESGQAGGEEGAAGGGGDEPRSFDDVLKESAYQAEFDSRVQKAVNTALTKAQEKWKALADDKLSEAEKLAKMTKEEKAEYLRQKKERELSEKEAAITRRELMAEAKNALAEKKLPVGLAEVLNYADEDSCRKSIEAVEKAFQGAIQAAVEEKLKGGKPPKKAPSEEGEDLAKQVEALMMGA